MNHVPEVGFDIPRPEHARRLPIAGIISGIALAILAKMVLPALPLINGHSLNEANSYCTGFVGALVRSLGGTQGTQFCNDVSGWMLASNLTAIAGVVITVISVIVLYRRTQRR